MLWQHQSHLREFWQFVKKSLHFPRNLLQDSKDNKSIFPSLRMANNFSHHSLQLPPPAAPAIMGQYWNFITVNCKHWCEERYTQTPLAIKGQGQIPNLTRLTSLKRSQVYLWIRSRYKSLSETLESGLSIYNIDFPIGGSNLPNESCVLVLLRKVSLSLKTMFASWKHPALLLTCQHSAHRR